MMQHLLNTTAIWLISLLVFDAALGRERYHGYNRIYLLTTFLTGIVLPLWQWKDDSVIQATGIARPVEQAAALRENIVANTATVTQVNWLMIVYLAGVAISLILLLREVFIITSLYRRGDRSKDGVWTIVETGKDHSPFSAFRYIFISSKKNYSPAELRMVLSHEEQHGHALHFIDLVIMQAGKIIFWFHPIVFLYHNRLVMVHEYQADEAVDKQPAEYGEFLVEQAILGPAPALSHSFNRSPIKKRIAMLTRKTSALAKGKQLVIAPLLLACLLFFTQKGFSEDKRKEGNRLYYKGNVFELWGPATSDTIMIEDPVTGEWIMKIKRADSLPVKMNGNYIFREDELARPERVQITKTRKAIQEYVIQKLQPVLENQEDGVYISNVNNVIVNEHGRLVYYERPFVMRNDQPQLDDDQIRHLIARLKDVLDSAPEFEPIKRGRDPVVFNIEHLFDRFDLWEVKDHKLR